MPVPLPSWDLSWWQAVFSGVAAAGTVGAAIVAWRALNYFRQQADAMTETLASTRDLLLVELARDRRAIRPDVWIAASGGVQYTDAVTVTIGFRGGKPTTDLAVDVVMRTGRVLETDLNGGDSAPTMDGSRVECTIKGAGLSDGDDGHIDLTYRDYEGSEVELVQRFKVDRSTAVLRLKLDGPPVDISDDPPMPRRMR